MRRRVDAYSVAAVLIAALLLAVGPGKPEPASGAGVTQTTEPKPARGGKHRPASNPGRLGFEFPGLGVGLVVAGALAILAASITLGLGLSTRRRRRGPPVDREPPPAPPARGSRPAPPPSGADRSGQRRGAGPAGPVRKGQVKAPMLGYAIVSGFEGSVDRGELAEQARMITGECARRRLELIELVRERESRNGKGLERPGLGYALARIAAGEARGLVVSELSRLSRSTAELGGILDWFTRSGARLVAVAQGLDTAEREGRLTARALIEVSGWERERLSERTHRGLEAARRAGRRAVTDDPELRAEIARMRAEGMTLQAIADRLNEAGVPTVRGGAKWRPSSVQAAVGYKRRPRSPLDSLPGSERPAGKERR
jgi:DNA invertase Pin-like site-specific DNA recombinase